jgi:trehalose/maltose hydrolase-like predicted phosphorylase
MSDPRDARPDPGGSGVRTEPTHTETARPESRRSGPPPDPGDARWWRRPEPGWAVVLEGDDPSGRRADAVLLTVADGRFGTRGTREECVAGREPWVMAAGVYRQHPGDIPRPLPGPLWFHLGVPADDDASERRWLDLRRGVLHRERHGAFGYRSARFMSLARPGIAVQRSSSGRMPDGDADPPLPVTEAVSWRRWMHGDLELSETRGIGTILTATHTHVEHQDGRVVVDRLASLDAHPTRRPATDPVLAALEQARTDGADRLLLEHEHAWAARWADAHIAIPGEPELELAVRFGLFHLMASVADHGEAAVGARGLSGPGYAGHVFWDADVFVLPFLAATHPSAARAMLEYRRRRLPAAHDRARAEGHAGCRLPWESAIDGSEATPTSMVALDGTHLPVRTGTLEEHIGADVAWAAWHHHLWSGDPWVVDGAAQPLVVETARYWASRLEQDTDGTAHLRGVIGPDEYHEDVDDNAYTNVMVRWHLRHAATLLAPDDPEAARWRELANRLVDGYDPRRGDHEQFTGYGDLVPLDMADVGEPPLAADVLLGRDRVTASQLIKQADVLLLHHLVPEELPAGSFRHDLDRYLPRTAHGSSLSPAVHASLLARDGRPEEAAAFLRMAATIDLDDVTGTTAGGLHVAAMGGVWQALAFGFLGLRPHPHGLAVDPRPLPSRWQALELTVRYRGQRVRLHHRHDRVEVRCDAELPLLLCDAADAAATTAAVVAGRVVLWRDGGRWMLEGRR